MRMIFHFNTEKKQKKTRLIIFKRKPKQDCKLSFKPTYRLDGIKIDPLQPMKREAVFFKSVLSI